MKASPVERQTQQVPPLGCKEAKALLEGKCLRCFDETGVPTDEISTLFRR